ncbi:hypothetical protein [Acidovorax sp. NB1]|uniref:hypothetical protein n=1 Tax=Acidovorax sp. NB1 TaxID=1943571 RepID=UPI0010E410EE|nr:hypothetical protein [Acidovorax sp. NB1]GDY37261.1 hypothetical protein ACINB_31530 [Acidovorax sp. NB1]
MQNVNTTVQQLLCIPGAPPPISHEEFEALRVRADLEHLQHREASRVHRALVDQVQHNAHMGVW